MNVLTCTKLFIDLWKHIKDNVSNNVGLVKFWRLQFCLVNFDLFQKAKSLSHVYFPSFYFSFDWNRKLLSMSFWYEDTCFLCDNLSSVWTEWRWYCFQALVLLTYCFSPIVYSNIFSGKTPNLWRHDLMMIHSKQTNRFSLPMNKIPEKLVPR